MHITVNGETVQTGETTLLAYLVATGVNPAAIAVELNLDIVAKSDYARTPLQAGDRIEIVHFVGGG